MAEFAKREKREHDVDDKNCPLTLRPIGLHVLVNNSGNNWGAPLEDYPDAAWDRVLTLNLQRVFTLTQKLVPFLLAGRSPQSDEGPWEDPCE